MAANYLQRLQEDSQQFLKSLSTTQKMVLGSVFVVLVILIVFVVTWASQPQWSVLYRDLNAGDAGAIVQNLKDNQVQYKISNQEGSTLIEVPAQQVHELRLQMAAQDLPKEGGVVGFELFDKDQMGMTNSLFSLNYQRALAGELSRTIMELDGIEKARVHLAIPKKQLFSELEEPPTASVTLKLRSGTVLNESQIHGISKLVAGSVPGLAYQNVTVTDTLGNILFDGDAQSEGFSQLSQQQLKVQRTMENQIKQDVKAMLTKVVGADHVNVQVKAELDFDKEEIQSKTYTPNNNQTQQDIKALRSEKRTVETGEGKNTTPGGVPGVTTNTPTYQSTATEGNSTYTREDNVKNYEVPETQTHRIKAPGQIKRLTLSVAIDSAAPLFQENNSRLAENQLLDRLKSLAITAAGIDSERGDSVAVHKVTFDTSENQAWEESLEATESRRFWMQVLQVVLALFLLLLLLAGLYLLYRRQKAQEIEEEEQQMDDIFLPESPETLALNQALIKRTHTVQSLASMAEDDPARMARLLRAWMSE